MWIIIPDEDGREPWVGKLNLEISSSSPLDFELVRNVNVTDLYSQSPFSERKNVIGLLDHQKPCTIVKPIVTSIDPGSFDVKNKAQRTIIKGEFQALLRDIAVENGDDKRFLGISFDSLAFDVWNASRTVKKDFDYTTNTPRIEIAETQSEEINVQGLGKVTCTTIARITSALRSSTVGSATLITIDFDAAKSLNEVMDICIGVERIFGFLVGFRPQYPTFRVWIENIIKSGDAEWNYDGSIEFANLDWKTGEVPSPRFCFHTKHRGDIGVDGILALYLAKRDMLADHIHAIEFCRFFSKNINDKFSMIMPVLDSYVGKKYKSEDEMSYLDSQAEFFSWVDSSPSDNVREFPKKHMRVVDSKAPGLQLLLTRAIDFVNEKGFVFPVSLAARIAKRRGALFHAAPKMGNDEVMKFYVELQAAIALLLLHTLMELGVDISRLSDMHTAMGEFRIFMKRVDRSGAGDLPSVSEDKEKK